MNLQFTFPVPSLFRILTVIFFMLFLLVSEHVSAMGGTSVVAVKNRPVQMSDSWPEGVNELVNHPARTWGLNAWFSEWPNDVNQYGLQIKSTDEMNRLLIKLAAIKSDCKQVHLSINKEPRALGFVTQVPEGNGISATFSIGDQAQLDQWYKNVRKPFGNMELKKAPVAKPPTLTIFVQNDAITLGELKIPEGVDVSIVDVPIHLQTSDKIDSKDPELDASELPLRPKLDNATVKTMADIKKFLERRARVQEFETTPAK